MPDAFLTLSDIAARSDLTVGAVRQLHKRSAANRASGTPSPRDMPEEDIRLGLTPGWRAATIAAWLETRLTPQPPSA